MRKRGRTDANQAAIVSALRQAGCSVWVTSSLGGGFPDLVVADRNGANVLLEIKDGKGDLTPDEREFFAEWRGPVHLVRTPDEALQAVGAV